MQPGAAALKDLFREMLERMRKECEVLNTIKRRKLEYFEHVIAVPKYASF